MSKMNQICDGYNPQVLMGNWYEEGYALYQPVRQDTTKNPRPYQINIGFKDNHGNLAPLNRISRKHPWNTRGLVQNMNSQPIDNKSVMKTSYDIFTVQKFHKEWVARPYTKQNQPVPFLKPSIQLNKVKNNYQILNEKNFQELNVLREADTNTFNSKLRPNIHIEPKLLLETMYQKSFCSPNTQNTFQNTLDKRSVNEKCLSKNTFNKNEDVSFRRQRSEITLKTFPNFIRHK